MSDYVSSTYPRSYGDIGMIDRAELILEGNLDALFNNPKRTPMFNFIMSFTFGALLAPWSSGIFFLVFFNIIAELALYIFSHGRCWEPHERAGVMMANILGWIVGRSFLNEPLLKEGVPEVPRLL